MADVNLVVEVSSAGIPAAIANIESLKTRSLSTQSAMSQLGTAIQQAMSNVSNATAGATGKIQGFRQAVVQTQNGALSLSRALRELELGYSKIGKLSPNASANDRLAMFGNGSLERGKELARTAQQLREAFNADPVRDLLRVEQQELEVLRQREQRLSNIAAQQSAKQSNSRAREDYANQARGVTALEQAEIRLARANADLTQAEFTRKVTGIGVDNTRRTAAYNAETQALREQIAATQALNREREIASKAPAANPTSRADAFQSSYSYFVLAGLAREVTQAISGIGIAAITSGAQAERAFVDVDRTFEGTANQLESLRLKLVQLSTTTPVSFVDLSKIAALGNQLGISADNIQSFTTTIAQYSAISGESADASATAFGKIANLTGLAASQYSNLGSAITYVARTSVATEATISRTAQEITALASGAGFSAASIVGLSGALSSLAIPPERARGALSLYFGALNSAIAEGGPKLAAFSEITGKTKSELDNLVRANKGEEVFTSFIKGLSNLDSVAKTSALKELGLSTIRVDQTMRALSQNVPLLTKSLAGANKAFIDNTELGRQYAKIQDTLSSKFIEFQNAVFLAATATGGVFAESLKKIIVLVTDLVVGFSAFAQSDFGSKVIAIGGVIAAVVFVIASLVGVLALAKASLVVTTFAFAGLGGGITRASSPLLQFLAGLVGVSVGNAAVAETATVAAGATTALAGATVAGAEASAAGAVANGALAVSGEAVAVGSRAAAAGLTTMKIALATTGVGLLVVLIGSLVTAMQQASAVAPITANDIIGLNDALKADTKVYEETGKAITTFQSSTGAATDEQKKAAAASKNWANVLGNDLVDGANKANNAVGRIAAGDNTVKAIADALGKREDVQGIITSGNFAKQFKGVGLNLTELITEGVKGGNVSKKINDALEASGVTTRKRLANRFGSDVISTYTDKNGKDITNFVNNVLKLGGAVSGTGTQIEKAANKTDFLSVETSAAAAAMGELDHAQQVASASFEAYQGSVAGGVAKFSNFATVLSAVQAAASAKGSGSIVDANAFGAELDAANGKAVSFYNGITKLATSGRVSFAQQLAELGPDAQGILDSALKLPDGGAALEADARFAAFLASDAFKAALQAGMAGSNDSLASLFNTTGNLDDVRSFIDAQVAGTESAWLAARPQLNLDINLKPLSPEVIAGIKLEAEGSLKIEPVVVPKFETGGLTLYDSFKKYTDTLTGKSITLPASLDGAALTASLGIWKANQSATPAQIQTLLNTGGLNGDLTNWVNTNGKITVKGSLVGLNTAQQVFGNQTVRINAILNTPDSSHPLIVRAKGGQIPEKMPGFASGGSWGRFAGGGTGTSDSLIARVSRGEYINTADSTNFWGPDFFDSLNRKMLPTSFANMLGGAIAAGNQGPTHVANVNVVQNNPLTRDPLKQLRADSELVASGIWG